MIELYQHQKNLVNLNPDRHALCWVCGTGKTFGVLALIEQKQLSVLIVCPKGLVQKWENDLIAFNFPVNLKFQIISKEQFKIHVKELDRYDAVIVDEAHYFFGTKSALMKSLRWYLDNHDIQYRYLLSGTVYRSSPMDIYIMCALLGKKLHYYEFQNRFFYQVRMGSKMIPMIKPNMQPQIAEIVHSVGSIVKMEDCVDMPPEIPVEDIVEATREQRDAITLLEGILPVTRYTAEHQIAGGTLKGNEYESTTYYESNKLSRLKEWIDKIERCIVVCRYNNEIEFLAEQLKSTGKRIAIIKGGVDNREELLKSLAGDEQYILIVNAMISEGWELSSCSHMIFYSYDFQLKNFIQMKLRLQRANKPRPVMYIYLMVKDTVDEAIHAALASKMSFHIHIYAKSKEVI